MDSESPRSRSRRVSLRLLGLGTAVLLIVLLPYFFSQQAIKDALDASSLVAHTAEVKAEIGELNYLMRDAEAASVSLAAGLKGTIFAERLKESLDRIDAQSERVTKVVLNEATQLVRVGRLKTLIEGRRRLVEEAMLELEIGRQTEALAALQRAATDYRVRELTSEIVQHEETLMARRTAHAAKMRRGAEWLTILAATAQLILLAIVIWLSERQADRRVRAERDAHKAVARAEAIFQTVREPIALLDARLNLLMHNSAFAELYGGHASDDATLGLAQVGGGAWNDPVLLQRLADVALRDRELWDHELRQRGADGRERILAINARRMRLPDRDDNVVLMTAADLTAHKRAEHQIRELNRQLEGKVEQISDANRELEAFSYSVSHDLRAPLRHISGFATKLERHLGEAVDDKTSHYLDVIGSSASRMAGLIDDLLVYSRLGRHAMRLQPVDMQFLVEEARNMLSTDLGERRVEWKVQPLPVVVADENMMRLVWQNLLGNAIKYTAQRELATIEVSSRSVDNGDSVEFSVRDNGAGFDMEYAGKLFGVFQRLHKASEFPGSGIGLANVRRILARHGGRVWAEAEPDRGATFRFVLPQARTRSPDQDLYA